MSVSEGFSNNFEVLKQKLEASLQNGELVIVEGDLATGKSFTLEQILPEENILATKKQGIEHGSISMFELECWKANSGSVGIDEPGLLTTEQLESAIASSATSGKGIILLFQAAGFEKYSNLLSDLITRFNLAYRRILFSQFDKENNCPVWRQV